MTTLILVSRPEDSPLKETERASKELTRYWCKQSNINYKWCT